MRVAPATRVSGFSDVGVGNRVEIAVEADIGGLAGADDAHQVGLEGMSG